MHPEISKPHQNNHSYDYNYRTPEPKPYETNLTFRVPDQTGIKKDGYIKLFEAAWSGDLEAVKAMTLSPWASGEEELPALKIAVQDGNGFSPFSIAVKRGHHDLAKKIVDICIAQYHTDDNKTQRERWNMRTSDSDDESDDDDDLPPIFSELVSDKFTVDDLGEVSNVVKSDVLPMTMIEWPCASKRFLEDKTRGLDFQSSLLEHAVSSNDMELLKFMVALGTEQQGRLAEEPDDRKSYTIDRSVFYSAIKLGRTEMLAEMIKSTGVGIPLNELIEKSGVEIKDKPKYYQGLSVGGKKRADWAQAPGGHVNVVEERIPPLLQAAHMGSIESVEWLMSDAPMRRYKEFAEKNKNDKRIKILDESNKGFDNTIGKWLNTSSKFFSDSTISFRTLSSTMLTILGELALHCAILWSPDKEQSDTYLALIKHLVSVQPESLEKKSSQGWTPLALAVWQRQEEVVSYLISVGANQRSRDRLNRNMVHSMVVYRSYHAKSGTKKLQRMIELFDKDAVKEMLLERCNESPGALTPLAYWMARNNGTYKKSDFIEILAKYSSGEELEMINGEGDLPLHVVRISLNLCIWIEEHG